MTRPPLPPGTRRDVAQRGQATTEFLVALLALVPVFIGVVYAGRYADLQQTATQASRYVAFERALQPDGAKLSDAKLLDQTRARFFVRPDHFDKKGAVRSDDSVAKLKKDEGLPAMWRDLSHGALLEGYDKVTLGWGGAPLGNGKAASALDAGAKLYGKSWTGMKTANLEIALVNRMDQASAEPKPLKIGATTAAAADAWNAGGATDVVKSIEKVVPSSMVPEAATDLLGMFLWLFETSSPQFGCIDPNIVPADRTKGKVAGGACK
jgi:hypothetical protein